MVEPALVIDTKDYFNKSQYKGNLEIVGDGRFGNYSIRWSEGGNVPEALKGTYTDTATAKTVILNWLHNISVGAEQRARRANAKVSKKPKTVEEETDG
jgi:hypothetical protein